MLGPNASLTKNRIMTTTAQMFYCKQAACKVPRSVVKTATSQDGDKSMHCPFRVIITGETEATLNVNLSTDERVSH